jgi:hypothetical protein
MTKTDGRYEHVIVNLSPGESLTYWFYFEPQAEGVQPITSQHFTYTQPGS